MRGAPARRKTGRKGGRSKVRTRQKTPPSTHPCEASGTREAAAMPAVHNSGGNAWQLAIGELLPRCFYVHAGLGGRQFLCLLDFRQSLQPPDLFVGDHLGRARGRDL